MYFHLLQKENIITPHIKWVLTSRNGGKQKFPWHPLRVHAIQSDIVKSLMLLLCKYKILDMFKEMKLRKILLNYTECYWEYFNVIKEKWK